MCSRLYERKIKSKNLNKKSDMIEQRQRKKYNLNQMSLIQDKFSKQWFKTIDVNKTNGPRFYLVKDKKREILYL